MSQLQETSQTKTPDFRFQSVIDLWKKAAKEGKEILTAGDFNINSQVWTKPQTEWTPYQRSHIKIIRMLQDQILDVNTTQIPTPTTREGINQLSTLDHIYSSHPHKIRTSIDSHTTSDHYSILIERYVKSIPETTQYRTFRDVTETTPNQIRAEILTHRLYQPTIC